MCKRCLVKYMQTFSRRYANVYAHTPLWMDISFAFRGTMTNSGTHHRGNSRIPFIFNCLQTVLAVHYLPGISDIFFAQQTFFNRFGRKLVTSFAQRLVGLIVTIAVLCSNSRPPPSTYHHSIHFLKCPSHQLIHGLPDSPII